MVLAAKTKKSPVVSGANKKPAKTADLPKPRKAQEALPDWDGSAGRPVQETSTLSPEVVQRQSQLIHQIKQHMVDHQLTLVEFAQLSGLNYGYLGQVMGGKKDMSKVEWATLKRFAIALKCPAVQVLIWAGVIGPEDAVMKDGLEERLRLAHIKMRNDTQVTIMCPGTEVWTAMSLDLRLRFIMMYEWGSQRQLLDHANIELDAEDLADVRFVLEKPRKREKAA